ncbi:hypothetical protein R6Q59_026582 [Mikania micrantha]
METRLLTQASFTEVITMEIVKKAYKETTLFFITMVYPFSKNVLVKRFDLLKVRIPYGAAAANLVKPRGPKLFRLNTGIETTRSEIVLFSIDGRAQYRTSNGEGEKGKGLIEVDMGRADPRGFDRATPRDVIYDRSSWRRRIRVHDG